MPDVMRNVLTCDQFDREQLIKIFKLTDDIRENVMKDTDKYKRALWGKVVKTIFYEPSTRTRVSFEAAAARLGASIVSTENAREASSDRKGESLTDTIKTISRLCDAIVIRHPDNNSAKDAASVSRVPILNAGSGSSEHPTQALLDVYTIMDRKKSLDNISVCVIGDLKYGRTIHSLIKLLSRYENVSIYGLSADELALPEEYIEYLKERGIDYKKCTSFDCVPKDVDILYQTRYQRERFQELGIKEEAFIIDKNVLDTFSKNTLLMHPLPRNGEISPDVDDDKRAIYFEQVENGMYVRMALLYMILDGKKKYGVVDYIKMQLERLVK